MFSQAPTFRISISLALSLIFLGWALTAYQASLWGWLGTIICLQHLARNGRSAIPIAMAWATVVLWTAAFHYSTPAGFLWRNARYWAASLIFLWIFVTSIIFTTAKIPIVFHVTGKAPRSIWLAASMLINLCLGLGACCYQLGVELQ